ncbi:hypothetical protein BP00DRAFT_247457 [Aspergillus indologenus CBS 114.80]|uniref:Uncharacterized protein n=1 Tax=Aspergillus indologenus CBS 114.80 TaxID=1450541 RepID=A0A2V5IKP3_9EURO|nr:hypothetical protein BP00DRAFT_247457 [Aspergillus indologenus CBS 114.80]
MIQPCCCQVPSKHLVPACRKRSMSGSERESLEYSPIWYGEVEPPSIYRRNNCQVPCQYSVDKKSRSRVSVCHAMSSDPLNLPGWLRRTVIRTPHREVCPALIIEASRLSIFTEKQIKASKPAFALKRRWLISNCSTVWRFDHRPGEGCMNSS